MIFIDFFDWDSEAFFERYKFDVFALVVLGEEIFDEEGFAFIRKEEYFSPALFGYW